MATNYCNDENETCAREFEHRSSDAAELGSYLQKRGIRARNVQEYIPIPMTVSCCQYYTGKDPFTGAPVAVSYKLSDTRRQKELIMWWVREQTGHRRRF
jgi:hypothetical protein